MYRPPLDPRYSPTPGDASWTSILTSYTIAIALFGLMVLVSHPLAITVLLASIVGMALVARGAVGLLRCFHECGEFSVDLGGRVRIAITQTSTDDSCPC